MEHFIRNTCTPSYSCNYPISKSCGWSANAADLGQELQLMFHSSIRMRKNVIPVTLLHDCWCEMIWVFLKLLIPWDFHIQLPPAFLLRIPLKTKNIQWEAVSVYGDTLLIRQVRGTDRKAMVTQITTFYNWEEKSFSEWTRCWILRWMNYNSRGTCQAPFLSAKNRNLRLKWTVEDWKNVAWSDGSGFLLRKQMVISEFSVNSMNPWT